MTIIKNFVLIALFMGLFAKTFGQQTLEQGKVEPYNLEVTFSKTSHLIFPAAIRYTDLGSELLIGEKAENAQNVLRVKAAVRNFEEETNFSVITEDGKFYNFNVSYNSDPPILNYDILKMQRTIEKEQKGNVQLEELGFNPPSLTDALLKTIYQKDKRYIRHIASRSYGIQFRLKGIYVHNGKFFFHTELKNTSNVPFVVDFCTYKVVDRQVGKRTVSQERQLTLIREYPMMEMVSNNSSASNVALLDQFTITEEQLLRIEIFEQNGSRTQILEIENSDLINAKPVSEIEIKDKL